MVWYDSSNCVRRFATLALNSHITNRLLRLLNPTSQQRTTEFYLPLDRRYSLGRQNCALQILEAGVSRKYAL